MLGLKSKKSSKLSQEEELIDETSTSEAYLEDFIQEETEVDLTVVHQTSVKKRMDFLTLFVIGAGLLGGTNLLLTFFTLVMVGQVANKASPTLVQLQGGRSVNVVPIGSKERTTESIQTFASETLVELFDWRGMIPSSDAQDSIPVPDPGVDIGNGNRVTYSTWAASYRIEDSWRPDLLQGIAALTPQSVFSQNEVRTQGILVVREMGQPTKTNEGQWQVDVVANLILFEDGDNVGKAIPFNKKVTIAAIDPPVYSNDPSSLQSIIYDARKSGMMIQYMEDLKI